MTDKFDFRGNNSLLTFLIIALFIFGTTYMLSYHTSFDGPIGDMISGFSIAFHFIPFALGYAQMPEVYSYIYYIVAIVFLAFIINYFIKKR